MLIWLQQLFMQVLIWLLAVIDSIFGVFAALGGISEVNVNAGDGHMTLTSYFLSLNTVQKAFWIVLIASVVICGVCTIVAIVKNAINAKGGEPKSHARTIGQAMSTLFISLFMAAFFVGGVGLADKLLATVNKELNGGEMQTMSANIIDVSLGQSPIYDMKNVQGLNDYDKETGRIIYVSYLYEFEKDENGKPLYYDDEKKRIMYINPATNEVFKDPSIIYDDTDGTYKLKDLSMLKVVYDKSGYTDGNSKDTIENNILDESVRSLFGDYESNLIGYPECWKQDGKLNPDSFNFVIAYLTAIILAVALIIAAFGLVKRLYDIVLLFIALPGVVATIPLDDGAKFKLWRETVISKVFLAFGSVLAVNVFFIVAPSLWNVSLPLDNILTKALLKVFLICGGALTISGGQLLFARLLGTSAEESREMGQSARTLMGGAVAGLGMAKAAGCGLFGSKNANGQRVGGALKGGAGLLGAVAGGAVNAIGGALGGQAYKHSAVGRKVSATQKALKGFGGSSGWFGRDKTTGGNTLGSALGGAIGSGFGKFSASGAAQKSGLDRGLAGGAHKLGQTVRSKASPSYSTQLDKESNAAARAKDIAAAFGVSQYDVKHVKDKRSKE